MTVYVAKHGGPGTPVVEHDARQRAWRTFAQGLAVDVLAALAIVLTPLVSELEWTRSWWLALAGVAGKTVIMALVSYVSRRLIPPS